MGFQSLQRSTVASLLFLILGLVTSAAFAGQSPEVPLFGIHEVVFKGPVFGLKENPVVDVELYTIWSHESGSEAYKIFGFWDGDGSGGSTGSVFKIRFCPTKSGKWTLIQTGSNLPELQNQKEGYSIQCVPSASPGFWKVDSGSPGGRWYQRSNGSHPYIIGNTLYSFLSEQERDGPNGSDIKSDILATARYFKKVRFGLTGDRYPHPFEKPFLDPSGKPTDSGAFSHRPNPAWFFHRVDLAVRSAFELDLIADLILNGPDTPESRSTLRASENGGDRLPFLRYMAARYGSFPNVWFCLSNEWDIKEPRFKPEEIRAAGQLLKQFLPYETPLSVHASSRDWPAELNSTPPWNDHVIVQYKIKRLEFAADFIEKNHWIGGPGKPVIDDELAYQGRGDQWNEADVIEAHLGAFLGGGYGTTGFKDPENKQGHYFSGAFRPDEHTAAIGLRWLREQIDASISFWNMQPVPELSFGRGTQSLSIFRNVDEDFRALEWRNHEYVLGTNGTCTGLEVHLPSGIWSVTLYDAIARTTVLVAAKASGNLQLEPPDSRAAFFHCKTIAD